MILLPSQQSDSLRLRGPMTTPERTLVPGMQHVSQVSELVRTDLAEIIHARLPNVHIVNCRGTWDRTIIFHEPVTSLWDFPGPIAVVTIDYQYGSLPRRALLLENQGGLWDRIVAALTERSNEHR